MALKDVGNKVPIYKLKTTDEVMKYYDEWGEKDKYNKDMVEWNYTGPQETVDVFRKYTENKEILIFDAGCGTGLVGLQLKKHGFKYFHGADLSQKLLDTIPKQLYQNLIKVDLNKPIDVKDNFYDATMCVGTFTFGHVKPQALDEFVRVTKKNGLICFTINEGILKNMVLIKKSKILKKIINGKN